MEITVVTGDITTQDVDAVVNAANTTMRGGGGVDGAIHRAGGPAVLEDCRRRFPRGLATGRAGWTTAGDMPATWVIHVVGPNHRRGQTDRGLLTSCYAEALAVADELGARTVAFPLVSAGCKQRRALPGLLRGTLAGVRRRSRRSLAKPGPAPSSALSDARHRAARDDRGAHATAAGWPVDDAAAAAVETLRGTPSSLTEARMVASDAATERVIRAAL